MGEQDRGIPVPRRAFLAGAASLPALAGARVSARSTKPAGAPAGLGLPGPFPGRVIEARHPGMVRDGKKDRGAIGAALDRGLVALTGADDSVAAWRTFVEPGEVVAIKVNPVGNPLAISSPELMLAVIDGLKAAGVKAEDIVVFERYRSEFINAGYPDAVPDGIAWGGLTYGDDPSQLVLFWPDGDDVSGYDPDEYVHMNLIHADHDPGDERAYRSHLGKLITKRADKVILLPVLKDHGSAGITGALKNMSHGLVNNVARSHSSAHANVCNQFIPEVVSHPIIREKCVLQIMDGLVGVYQGGPFGHADDTHWTWENNALLLATDPVAMDRIEWDIIDAKRREMGLAPVGAVGKLAEDADREGFDVRQPQHVVLCGYLGLGEYRPERIDHRIIEVA